MEEDFGASFISITDDNGEEYMLFLPADMDENDPDYGFIILKVVEVDGEEQFDSVDDDDELQAVYELFMEQIFSDEDEDQ